MPRAAEPPSIAVQKASGKPRLEVMEGGAPPGTPGSPPSPLPPPPAAAEPLFGPQGELEQVRRPWRPEEAALAVAGAHNAAWTGALFIRHEQELLEPAYADPKELAPASESLARLLDHSPLEPGGAGPLGILGDLLVSLQGVVSLEVRHLRLVDDARQRLSQHAGAPPRAATPAPPRPAPPPASMPPRPSAGTPPAPRQPPPDQADESGGYHFSADQLAVLAAVDNPLSHRPGRNVA